MRIATTFAVVLALSICAMIKSCNDPYGGCGKASADIGITIAQAMNTADQLRQQGSISAAEESKVISYFEFANKANEAFQSCALAAHGTPKPGAFTACASTLNSTLSTPSELALINVQNPRVSQTINTIVIGLTTAVTAISTQLGGS